MHGSVEVAVYGVEAHGTDYAAVFLQKVGHHDAAEAGHVSLAQLTDQVADHVFTAAAHQLGGIQLYVRQAALGNALERSVFLAEEFTAVALIVFETVVGAAENLLYLLLIAESVEIVDEVFNPSIQIIPG